MIGVSAERELIAQARKSDPFACGVMDFGDGPYVYGAGTVAERLRMIDTFTAEQCRLALAMASLQQTVRRALEKRLRKVGGQAS